MPNIKSAEKRVSVTATKKLQNQMIRSQMQTAIKNFNAAISNGDIALAKQLLPVASSKIDNAAIKHVIHKNAANRKKAQISKTLSQLERGVIVVKVDAKTLKQAEQKAAAAKKAEEAAAIKAQRNEAKKAKEAAKAPAPAKKTTKKAAAPKASKEEKATTKKTAASKDGTAATTAKKTATKKAATKKVEATESEAVDEIK